MTQSNTGTGQSSAFAPPTGAAGVSRSGPPTIQPRRAFLPLALGLAVSFGLACAVSPAWPQQLQCGPHASVVDRLGAQYGEYRVAFGMTANGLVMETFASRNTGTWTVTITDTTGNTCLIAAGTDYDDTQDKPEVDG